MKPTNTFRAFTLIEVMMVVLIMGILMAIALPSYFNAMRDARLRASNSNARAIATAVQGVMTRSGTRAYTGLTLTNAEVLKELNNIMPLNDCATTAKQATTGGWTATISGTGDSTWTLTSADAGLCKSAPSTVVLGGP